MCVLQNAANHSTSEDAAPEVLTVGLPTLSRWATPRALQGKGGSKSGTPSVSIRAKARQRMKRSPPCWTVMALRRLAAAVGGSMTHTQGTECQLTSRPVICIPMMSQRRNPMCADTISTSVKKRNVSPFLTPFPKFDVAFSK